MEDVRVDPCTIHTVSAAHLSIGQRILVRTGRATLIAAAVQPTDQGRTPSTHTACPIRPTSDAPSKSSRESGITRRGLSNPSALCIAHQRICNQKREGDSGSFRVQYHAKTCQRPHKSCAVIRRARQERPSRLLFHCINPAQMDNRYLFRCGPTSHSLHGPIKKTSDVKNDT